jgi:hypothetical protein
VLDPLRDTQAVSAIDLRSEEAPPALAVTFDPHVIEPDKVVAVLVKALRAHPDPLYTQELEVRYPEGAR